MAMLRQYPIVLLVLLLRTVAAAIGSPSGDNLVQTLLQSKLSKTNLTTPSNPDTAKFLAANLITANVPSKRDHITLRRHQDGQKLRFDGSVGSVQIPSSQSQISHSHELPENHLERRDDGVTWDYRVDVGNWLLCLMEAQTESDARLLNGDEPVASIFTDFDLLWRWGYNTYETSAQPHYGNRLDQAFLDLDINPANNVYCMYAHLCAEEDLEGSREIVNDEGEVIPPNYAKFFNMINGQGRTIIADDNQTPRGAGVVPDGPWPDMFHWSDVVFLLWQEYSPSPRDLKYVIRAGVKDPDSVKWAIQAVIKSQRLFIPDYPNRVTFTMDTDLGKAILGSRNGAGVGYLLAQHKEVLGLKTIISVTLWCDKPGGWATSGANDPVLLDGLYLIYYFEISD